jgi:anti-anti-sigma factor
VPREARCFTGRDLDVESAPALLAQLDALVNETSLGVIVVDCRDLTFIDSAGFRALLAVQRRLDSQGRRLRVTHLSAPMRRTFDLMGVTGVLRVRSA